MHLERRLAVFQIIVLGNGLPGKFALLADQNERLMEIVSEHRAIDKAAGLRSDDHVKIQILDHILHGVDREFQTISILKNSCDIAEHNAGFREIGNSADIIF